MSTIDVATIQSQADETPPVFKDAAGSREIVQGAWAWAHFNGIGTLAVDDSFNVSSVTDNGTGDYTLNFANSLPNANYAVGGSGTSDITLTAVGVWISPYITKSVSALRIETVIWSGTRVVIDSSDVSAVIFCNP